jgi:hypothetical protein
LVPVSVLLLLPFCFKCFLLATFSSQVEEKKNRREGKKCREGEGFTFKRSFCPFTFGSHFWSPVSALSFQALSPCHLLLLKQTKRKKNTKNEKSI